MTGGNRWTGQDERQLLLTRYEAGFPLDADHLGHGVTP